MGIIGTVVKSALAIGTNACTYTVVSSALESILPVLPETASTIDKVARVVGVTAVGSLAGAAVGRQVEADIDYLADVLQNVQPKTEETIYEA